MGYTLTQLIAEMKSDKKKTYFSHYKESCITYIINF
jgi:hypothetical protein